MDWTKCPICLEELNTSSSIDDGRLLEREEVCPNGCYSWRYDYGNTTWNVCGREWWVHWTTDKGFDEDEIQAWISEMRRRWQIRASTPLNKDTPFEIVADWLEEHGEPEVAAYLRGGN